MSYYAEYDTSYDSEPVDFDDAESDLELRKATAFAHLEAARMYCDAARERAAKIEIAAVLVDYDNLAGGVSR